MVSVSTSVPAMKATPRATASAVASSRSLWATTPCKAVRNIAVSLPEPLHPLEDQVRRRVRHLVDGAAVGEEDDPVGEAGRDRVVGDHHDGLTHLVDGPAHERQ